VPGRHAAGVSVALSVLVFVVTLAAEMIAADGTRLPAQEPTAAPPKISVKDKVYTKAQADFGKDAYKDCVKCHALDDAAAKLEGPPLAGEKFLTKWDGKTVFELAMNIRLNMPPDGSFVVEEQAAADLIAYLLQVNGFPDGERTLKADVSARSILMARNK
jgi:hypothetical protein